MQAVASKVICVAHAWQQGSMAWAHMHCIVSTMAAARVERGGLQSSNSSLSKGAAV